MLYGCDSWGQLASRLANCCFETKKNDSTLITYKEREHLKNDLNSKKVITICKNILSESGNEGLYEKILSEALSPKPSKLPVGNIFDNLYKLGLGGGLYLTTNADNLFSAKFSERLIISPKTFDRNHIDNSFLYHLHGSINEPESLVFTVPEYLKRYGSEPNYLSFLTEVFSKYTILFVGYGLEELEILEYLITKSNSKPDTQFQKVPNRFVLIGMYKGEENILRIEQKYFKELGIEVIAYQKDFKGYHQLEDVIEAWSNQVNQASKVLPKNFDEIKNICDKGKVSDINRINHLVQMDLSRENHFWKCLGTTPNPKPWLGVLYKKDAFDPKKSPVPVRSDEKDGYFTISSWNVLPYLENISKANHKNKNKKTTTLIKKIISENFDYIKTLDGKERNDRTEWYLARVILFLPIGEISLKHISALSYFLSNPWGGTLIASDLCKYGAKRILEEGNIKIISRFFKSIFDFRKSEGKLGVTINSVLDNYWLRELLDKNKQLFIDKLGKVGVDALLPVVGKVFKASRYSFGTTWIPAIDGSRCNFSERYEIQLIFTIRSFIDSILDRSQLLKISEALHRMKGYVYKRLLFHLYRVHYRTLNRDLWKQIETNPLLQSYEEKYEIYMFLKDNCPHFTKKEIKKVISWIEEVKVRRSGIPKKRKDLIEAYIKKEWLSSMLDSNNNIIIERFNHYDEINPSELNHPGFSTWSESGFVKNVSPYSKEEILKLSIDEQIELINSFKEEKNIFRDKPSKEGLGETLENIVLANPLAVIDNLNKYMELEEIYVYYLTRGLNKIEFSNEFHFEQFFLHISTYLSNVKDWSFPVKNKKGFSYQEIIIGEICSILRNIFNDEMFEELISDEISKILIFIWGNLKPLHSYDKENDITIVILNSVRGKLYETITLFLLWKARNVTFEVECRWDALYKEKFTSELLSQSINRELYGTLGKFIRNFLYLDSSWVWENWDSIFPADNEEIWKDSISSLLFYMNDVYEDIFQKLKEGGHYKKALSYDFFSKDISKRVVDHIVVAFIYGIEDFVKGALIHELIGNGSESNLIDLISFLAYRDIETDEEVKKRILELWIKIYDSLAGKDQDRETQRKLVNLARVQKHFDSLSVNFNNLKKSYSSLNEMDFSFELLEILEDFVEEEAELVGELMLATINSGFYFSYKEELLIKIVKGIYQGQQLDTGNRICIAYLAKGINYLQPIYLENNPDIV